VIVGAGLTGGTAAKTLRKLGYAGELLIVAGESSLPFGRPPLTKGYLRGEEDLSNWMVAPPDWYGKHQVQLVPAKVSSVDPAARQVKLDSGHAIGYERLLLATGGRNRRLDIPGSSLPGIHQLRTIAECDAIKRAAKPGARVVVVGSGFIGSEVAASLREVGLSVTSIMRGKAPLDAVLGPEVGGVFAAIHRAAGIELVTEDEVVQFQGSSRGERAITPDTALRLSRFFGTSAEFWLNLQVMHELEEARRRQGGRRGTARQVDESIVALLQLGGDR